MVGLKVKNKLIVMFKNNGKLSFVFHRLALFVVMTMSSYLLLTSDISLLVSIPAIVLVGAFIVDVDTMVSEVGKNENN